MATKTFRTRVAVLLPILIAPLLLSSCFLIEIASWPDGQNVLVNGSFEDDLGVFNPNVGYMLVKPEQTTIPGWTVTGIVNQNVAWYQNKNSEGLRATDGSHFLDLTGENVKDSNKHFGGVKQTVPFPTVVGHTYHVSFDIGVRNGAGRLAGPITVVAVWGGPNEENPKEAICGPFNPPGPDVQWMTCGPWPGTGDFDFKAASATSTLRLYGALGDAYIGLDKVSVECVAPLGRHTFCTNTTLGQ